MRNTNTVWMELQEQLRGSIVDIISPEGEKYDVMDWCGTLYRAGKRLVAVSTDEAWIVDAGADGILNPLDALRGIPLIIFSAATIRVDQEEGEHLFKIYQINETCAGRRTAAMLVNRISVDENTAASCQRQFGSILLIDIEVLKNAPSWTKIKAMEEEI